METLLLIIAVLPAVILGIIVYKNDNLEKESSKLLFKLLMGGLGAIALTLLFSLIFMILFPFFSESDNLNLFSLLIYCFIEVALIEEFSKWFFLKKITWNNSEFNHIYDAIVYASFVSLGFATIENIMYVLQAGIFVGLGRAILSVPAHLFFGIFMGYFYGLSKQAEYNGNAKLSKKNMLLSILVPTILHGIFDYCLFSGLIPLIIFFLIFVIFLYIKAFKTLKRVSKVSSNFKENIIDNAYCYNCGSKLNGMYCHNCGTKKLE